jgi:hypothetical protein
VEGGQSLEVRGTRGNHLDLHGIGVRMQPEPPLGGIGPLQPQGGLGGVEEIRDRGEAEGGDLA